MLLLYLYTLELPAGRAFKSYEGAYVLGDKYGLPKLCKYGKRGILSSITRKLANFAGLLDKIRRHWLAWIRKMWKWTMSGANELKCAVLDALVTSAESVIEHEDFFKLAREDEQFHRAFLKTLAAKVAEIE